MTTFTQLAPALFDPPEPFAARRPHLELYIRWME